MIILVALSENVDDELRLESQPPPRAPFGSILHRGEISNPQLKKLHAPILHLPHVDTRLVTFPPPSPKETSAAPFQLDFTQHTVLPACKGKIRRFFSRENTPPPPPLLSSEVMCAREREWACV